MLKKICGWMKKNREGDRLCGRDNEFEEDEFKR